MRRLILIGTLLLLCHCGGTATSTTSSGTSTTDCDPSSITTYTYLMAFHACASDCTSPANHTIYLAGSNNGTTWTLIPEFTGLAGSVPDLVYANNLLYLFHTGTNHWATVNACFDVIAQGTTTLSSATDSGGFVDPSLVVSGDQLVLFYLPGVTGADPAGCTTYPCTKEIHSATAALSAPTAFTQVSGARASTTLSSGTFSDPDLVTRTDGSYLLYVSSGPSTLVFTGTALDGTFTSPDGATNRTISNVTGGVPGAIEVNGEIWLYVTSSTSGVEIIRRAVSSDGVTALAGGDFTTVVDATISSGFTSTTNVSSPSILTWPDAQWSRATE